MLMKQDYLDSKLAQQVGIKKCTHSIYSAPPDRGLASSQISGKKSNRFRITVTFICNQDGSEKWPIFYIGKSKQPRCFKKKKPTEYGFRYRNNKTSWMTAKFFEE